MQTLLSLLLLDSYMHVWKAHPATHMFAQHFQRNPEDFHLLVMNTEEMNNDFKQAITADMILDQLNEEFCSVNTADGIRYIHTHLYFTHVRAR